MEEERKWFIYQYGSTSYWIGYKEGFDLFIVESWNLEPRGSHRKPIESNHSLVQLDNEILKSFSWRPRNYETFSCMCLVEEFSEEGYWIANDKQFFDPFSSLVMTYEQLVCSKFSRLLKFERDVLKYVQKQSERSFGFTQKHNMKVVEANFCVVSNDSKVRKSFVLGLTDTFVKGGVVYFNNETGEWFLPSKGLDILLKSLHNERNFPIMFRRDELDENDDFRKFLVKDMQTAELLQIEMMIVAPLLKN